MAGLGGGYWYGEQIGEQLSYYGYILEPGLLMARSASVEGVDEHILCHFVNLLVTQSAFPTVVFSLHGTHNEWVQIIHWRNFKHAGVAFICAVGDCGVSEEVIEVYVEVIFLRYLLRGILGWLRKGETIRLVGGWTKNKKLVFCELL
jgi:hypothetical protein